MVVHEVQQRGDGFELERSSFMEAREARATFVGPTFPVFFFRQYETERRERRPASIVKRDQGERLCIVSMSGHVGRAEAARLPVSSASLTRWLTQDSTTVK
jgi:hypothetical protein